jgi:ketosteroid isomerase-like protein
MKPIHAVAALAILTSSFAFAASQAASGTTDSDVQQNLMRLEHEDSEALIKGNVAVLDRDTSDSFAFTAPDGMTSTKADLINSVKTGDLKFESSVIDNMKVMQYGDTAVVTYTTTDKGSWKGHDISGNYRWTDVWVKQGPKWQLVAGQGTPIMATMKTPAPVAPQP